MTKLPHPDPKLQHSHLHLCTNCSPHPHKKGPSQSTSLEVWRKHMPKGDTHLLRCWQ